MFFASDNAAGVPEPIMAAMAQANNGFALAYGNDAVSTALRDQIRAVFEAPKAEVALVGSGSANNALALSLLTPPYGSIFCHAAAHIADDECGAPEFYTGGAKLRLIDGDAGKITPVALQAALAKMETGIQMMPASTLSLTNVTEAGTVYSATEIATLTRLAKANGLATHLDGARFSNALAATGATPAEMSWKAGIDILSLGGTKNGLLLGEAVILFDPAQYHALRLRQKRGGLVMSKLRFMAAQMQAWLEGGYWLQLAHHANAMAARLAQGLGQIDGAELRHPVEANVIFVTLPEAAHRRAKAAGAVYYDYGSGLCRLVCSWSTTPKDVDHLLAAFQAE